MTDRRKFEEKERLMREILNKEKERNRANSSGNDIPITLTTGSGDDANIDKTVDSVNTMSQMLSGASRATSDLLKNADRSFDELRKLLTN